MAGGDGCAKAFPQSLGLIRRVELRIEKTADFDMERVILLRFID